MSWIKEVAILAGNDGAILTCLKEGGAGGIAGRANIWPETVAKIYDCFKAGDLEGAQAAQDAIAILQQTFKYGNPNTIVKTAVALQGHPCGQVPRTLQLCAGRGHGGHQEGSGRERGQGSALKRAEARRRLL